jgi:cation diffusion facilitator CzcD-associated flavoprotein CzcO
VTVREHEVVIVGGGFAGVGAAIRLLQAGIDDFALIEKAPRLGGTWRDNSYPGCACDVPSTLYSYSFAPNPDWTRVFARQDEILEYLERTAADHGVNGHAHPGTELTAARWDESRSRWEIETSRGRYSAHFLIIGAGPLH